MRPLRFPIAIAALICAALVSWTAQAPAQTASVQVGTLSWNGRPASNSGQKNNVVNRKDCLTPDVTITFHVTITGVPANQLLQVWSGSDCGVKANRDQNNSCVKVYEMDASTGTHTIAVRDMLQKFGDSNLGVGTGTEMTCDEAGGASGATKRFLWFLVMDPASLTNALAQSSWEFSYDMTAPTAPVGAKAGPGEESLVVSFDAPKDTDLARYRVYCSDDAGDCSSATLVGGEDPPADMADCGSVNTKAATSVTATGLVNGKSYAVAVVSEDLLGNTSKLSNVTCGVPQEVTGFYEAYRDAGGEAGGGFFACSVAPAKRGAYGALGALVLAAVALWRRRR